jgi:short subunit dehydrogenase-like uncharacterized protein
MDGKRQPEASTASFLFTIFVGVPVWLTTIVPLTATYQIGSRLVLPIIPVEEEEDVMSSLLSSPSTHFPDPSQLKPLDQRTYDVVLLGSTGFTGGLTAQYLANTYKDTIKWAIAGRNKDKLYALRKKLAHDLQDNSFLDLPIIIADALDPSTLHTLVQDTRTVISTAGPFCKYGSHVVEFCARYGTSYVDITGETGWNKEMIMKWDDIAQSTGAKIVSLCGCDSIPWDLTYFKLAQLLKKECQDDMAKLQIYDTVKGGISGGTIDTMLQFLEGRYKEPRYSMDPYYKKPNGEKSSNKTKDKSPFMIKALNRRFHQEEGEGTLWSIPWIMSSVNSEVIKRSHALNDDVNNTLLSYEESWIHHSFKNAFITWFGTIFAGTALLNPITGTLMKKFVLPTPGQGPTQKQMDHGYLLLSGVGEGTNGSMVESEFYFPGDPGYKETARMVAESGLCLALNAKDLPVQTGGFYSPSAAMGDVLLSRLCLTGCKFASRVVRMAPDGTLQSKL